MRDWRDAAEIRVNEQRLRILLRRCEVGMSSLYAEINPAYITLTEELNGTPTVLRGEHGKRIYCARSVYYTGK